MKDAQERMEAFDREREREKAERLQEKLHNKNSKSSIEARNFQLAENIR